jgi:hypothetical protein
MIHNFFVWIHINSYHSLSFPLSLIPFSPSIYSLSLFMFLPPITAANEGVAWRGRPTHTDVWRHGRTVRDEAGLEPPYRRRTLVIV